MPRLDPDIDRAAHVVNVPRLDDGPSGDGDRVDLLWLPLGAGQRVVAFSGRTYERLQAWRQSRAPMDLYHAALEVATSSAAYAIELTPVPDDAGATRGVVAEGPVGMRWLGRWRLFRYELRCWPSGAIPDRAHAVDSPRRLTTRPDAVSRLLSLLPEVPTPVWGRDELRLGEMWNSNSVVAWLLTRARMPMSDAQPPAHGRAPGWDAGERLALRQTRRDEPAA